jgi:hypothetical protein
MKYKEAIVSPCLQAALKKNGGNMGLQNLFNIF